METLRRGKPIQRGLVADFISDVTESARKGLPVYSIGGGLGYLWGAHFDDTGRGSLQISTVDASALGFTQPAPMASPSPQAQGTLQTNEPADAQEQADMLASMQQYRYNSDYVPYQPDALLSQRAASVQPLHDYWLMVHQASEQCQFPQYTKITDDALFEKVMNRLHELFPDGRDFGIANNHLSRHTTYQGPDAAVDCAKLRPLLDRLGRSFEPQP